MKKVLLTMVWVLLLGIGGVKAQYTLIPDSNFAQCLKNWGYSTCFLSGTNLLDTTCKWVVGRSSISCASKDIELLEGVQYFDSLTSLNCSQNRLTYIPPLSSLITNIECANNSLTALPPLPKELYTLICSRNFLNTLPDIPPTLRILSAYNNQITFLPALPPQLQAFDVSFNPELSCLPVLEKFTGTHFDFNIYGTKIKCLPNLIEHSNPIPVIDSMPLCNNFNPNGCPLLNSIETLNFDVVHVYPNPATSQLFIQTTDFNPQAISIFDMSGRKVMEEKYAPQTNISSLSPGVYLIEVKGEKGSVRKRWVKM